MLRAVSCWSAVCGGQYVQCIWCPEWPACQISIPGRGRRCWSALTLQLLASASVLSCVKHAGKFNVFDCRAWQTGYIGFSGRVGLMQCPQCHQCLALKNWGVLASGWVVQAMYVLVTETRSLATRFMDSCGPSLTFWFLSSKGMHIS